eukprot:m.748864 g.748864  ORF g.748864 m.748864 type:complete len:802 (+) comp23149_c0_seq5:202-2607(+)
MMKATIVSFFVMWSMPHALHSLLVKVSGENNWPWDQPQTMQFPKNAYLLNVQDMGARGDGKTDDTLALQLAINATKAFQILYFPKGEYLISKPLLRFGGRGPIVEHFFLRGECVTNTKIILKDKSAAFQNVSTPNHMLHIGSGVAQNFFNTVENICLDVGSDNPGAIALRFDTNNMGSLRNVSLIGGTGSDTSGLVGLDFSYSDQIGPLLVKWLQVEGFDTSIQISHSVDSMTFNKIWLTEPRTAGVVNTGQVVSMRSLVYSGVTPAVVQHSDEANAAFFTLVDSTITGTSTGGNASVAINGTDGMMVVRNVAVTGYDTAIMHRNAVPPTPPPPATCVNSTQVQGKGVRGTYVLQSFYNGAPWSATACCSFCNKWNENISVSHAPDCTAWVLNQNTTHDFGVCVLHHCYANKCTIVDETSIMGLTENKSTTNDSRLGVSPDGDGPAVVVPGGYVQEWFSHDVVTLFEKSTNVSMNLTVYDAPESPQIPISEWADGIAPIGNCTCKEIKRNGTKVVVPDCSPLLQTAMDSGAAVVYIAYHNSSAYGCVHSYYGLQGHAAVTVPRTVQRFIATQMTQLNLTINEGDASDPPLVIEGMGVDGQSLHVHHTSKRAVILRDMGGVSYTTNCVRSSGHSSATRASAVGDLYIEDIVTNQLDLCDGQKVHALQLNTESGDLDITVSGEGTEMLIFGYKIERGEGGLINVTDGAKLQVDGTFAYTTSSSHIHGQPAFACKNAQMSVSYREYNADCKPFLVPVLEQRGSDTRELTRNFSIPGFMPGHGNSICHPPIPGSGVCLYSGVPIP